MLATSGGRTATGPAAHPVFFDGFLGHPEQAAAALLAVAKVARTRFYTPPGMVAAILRAADPVVTSNGDRLRFESFSACCGVYARYDALPGSLDGTVLDTGTTNVDFNPPMRDALARIGGLEPLHLQVGEDVVVRTLDAEVTEKKVPAARAVAQGLRRGAARQRHGHPGPRGRRVRGPAVRPRACRAPAAASRSGSSPPAAACGSPRGRRRTASPSPGSTGSSRSSRCCASRGPCARTPLPTTRRAPPASGSWSSTTPASSSPSAPSPAGGSPAKGECSGTSPTSSPPTTPTSSSALLAFEPRIDVARLAAESGLPEERVTRALGRLGAAGRVGYDAAEAAYFHRELPYDAERLATMHPRLRDATALVEAGAVRIDGDTAHVRSGDTDHVVRRTADGDRCTCPWYAKHKGSRGPCKHVLAADLVRKQHA